MRRLLFISLMIMMTASHAGFWRNLWSTPDQQGQHLMKQGKFKKAGKKFTRSDWSAAAAYRVGDYPKAAQEFSHQQSADGFFNAGNALAYSKKYKEALSAYDKALKIDPDHQDAIYNKKIVEQLLKKQKKNQNKDKQDKDKQDKDKQDKDKQDKDKQDKDKQDKDKQDKDKQDKDKQDKDKQDKDKQSLAQAQKDKAEKQREKEQLLKLIPDDPGGLLREKFLRDHIRRQRGWYQ